VPLGALPAEHRHLFVGQLVHVALDGGHNALVLTERLLTAARKRSVISPERFERILQATIVMNNALSVNMPRIYECLIHLVQNTKWRTWATISTLNFKAVATATNHYRGHLAGDIW
jgi:hypothetical protein